MNPFRQLTNSFIFTFGITPPRPEQERTATVFISALLFGTILLVLGLAVLILRHIFV
ncbi:hypothetical protein [Paracidobacterium acidisoli]|nr:hypothetical protein [Paracidobacterium acidisoli]MBT9330901.1 hypothetical protein [Paracidobacterium acidisoli]